MKLSVIIAATVVFAATVVPAIFDGSRTFRWGTDREVDELAERLRGFPTVIGEWVAAPVSGDQGSSCEIPLEETARDMLQPIAYINRRYMLDDQPFDLFILLGPTGETAVHTPDICFSSNAFRQVGGRRRSAIDDENRSSCFLSQFESRDVAGVRVQSWYAWTVDGVWQSPEQPRFHFAGSRYLVKIQLTSWFPEQDQKKLEERCRDFVEEIANTLRAQLF